MDLRNKTTSEFRRVFHSPLGVPNSQVSLYISFSAYVSITIRGTQRHIHYTKTFISLTFCAVYFLQLLTLLFSSGSPLSPSRTIPVLDTRGSALIFSMLWQSILTSGKVSPQMAKIKMSHNHSHTKIHASYSAPLIWPKLYSEI